MTLMMPQNQSIWYFTLEIREDTPGVQNKNSMLLLLHFSGGRNDKNIEDLLFTITVKTLN